MKREQSLKVINAFITELGAPAATGTPPSPVEKKEVTPVSPRPVATPASENKGLGALITGCAGFEIGAAPQPANVPPGNEGVSALIQGCKGFEIGASRACGPAAAPAPAKAPEAVTETDPQVAAARKALGNLANKPLLLSLLQYYASESQKPCRNGSMLKTTKEQIMKHWPMLALSPLIAALDGAAE